MITTGDYPTRNGSRARIFMVSPESEFPLIGALEDIAEPGKWAADSWDEDGSYGLGHESGFDIVVPVDLTGETFTEGDAVYAAGMHIKL